MRRVRVARRWWSGSIAAWLVILQAAPALAQITLDGSLGPAGSPPKVGSAYTIGAGLGQTRGANLFHSFGLFNLNTGERATFTGPPAIQNILARVTGGSFSFIDGVLRSTINGANLFLLNPRGVFFGPNAALDIRGSFHVSTADYLRLADGGTFHTSLAQVSALTVAPPVAFGFLGASPAPIVVAGSQLQVPDGRTLSLIGGDLGISDGALVAAVGGRVNLASVGSAGEVVIRNAAGQPTLSADGFARMGSIAIDSGSLVFASGDGGGTVAVRGGSLVVDSANVFADTSGDVNGAALGIDIKLSEGLHLREAQLTADGFGAGRPGDIAITAASAELTDGSVIGSRVVGGAGANVALRIAGAALLDTGATLQSGADGSGPGGALLVDAGSVALRGGSQIISQTTGTGPGGSVSIAAREQLSIEGVDSGIFAVTAGSAAGGAIHVAAPAVAIDGGGIATLGFGTGRTGDVLLEGRTLTLTGGGFIRSNADGIGQGGLVTINATESVSISGRDDVGAGSGIFTASLAGGAAGGVRVSTPSLTLADGAEIQIVNEGAGRAGDLAIDVGRLTLTGGSDVSSIAGAGRGGDVLVTARESVSITGQAPLRSEIGSAAVGEGDGGRVLVRTPALILGDHGSVVAQTHGPARAGAVVLEVDRLTATGEAVIAGNTAGSGDAGGVSITATSGITLTGNPPTGDTGFRGLVTIASGQAGQGTGAPGPIEIVTPDLTLTNAAISASTGSAAPAGDIRLDVGRLSLTDSRIESRTASGGDTGRVTINASESIELTSIGRGPGSILTGIVVTTEGAGSGREVVVRAPLLTLDGAFITGNTFATGRGADVSIDVGTLNVRGGAQIATGAQGPGSGGNLTVSASTAVAISGGLTLNLRSGLLTSTSESGAAGNVTVAAPVVTLTDAGVIAAQTFGSGPGGAVVLQVGRLDVREGSRVDSSTFGPGPGGTVTVAASEIVRVEGTGFDGRPSGIFSGASGSGMAGQLAISSPEISVVNGVIGASTAGAGRAGDIRIQAGRLTLLEDASIESSTTGAGPGGTVFIDAGSSLSVSGSRITSSAQDAGAGGSIDIRAAQIDLVDAARISATSTGQGNAGNIAITAPVAFVSRGSAVTTEARSADGGNIVLHGGELVRLIDSQVTATVQGGEGRGGNIQIGGTGGALATGETPAHFVILENSQIRADAFGGPGGRVNINADVFLTNNSIVSASSALGVQGTVDINAAITDISGYLARLPESALQAAALFRESCAARFAGGRPSSLAMGGRDALPPEPGALMSGSLPSPSVAAARAPLGEQHPSDPPAAMALAAVRLQLRCFR